MKKFYVLALCLLASNLHPSTVEKLDQAEAGLKKDSQGLLALKTTLNNDVRPVLGKALATAKDMQSKKGDATDKLNAHRKKIDAVVGVSTAMAHLGADKTAIGSKAAAYRKAYLTATALEKTVDGILGPVVKSMAQTNKDLADIAKDGGLIDQIVAANNETLAQLDATKNILSLP